MQKRQIATNRLFVDYKNNIKYKQLARIFKSQKSREINNEIAQMNKIKLHKHIRVSNKFSSSSSKKMKSKRMNEKARIQLYC